MIRFLQGQFSQRNLISGPVAALLRLCGQCFERGAGLAVKIAEPFGSAAGFSLVEVNA